jgi:hypothetical protein
MGEWDGTVWLTDPMLAEHNAQPEPGWSAAHTERISGNLVDFIHLGDTPEAHDELLRVIIGACIDACKEAPGEASGEELVS